MAQDIRPSNLVASALEVIAIAGMAREPLARAVLPISVIEMLANKTKRWSAAQKALLERLEKEAAACQDLETSEATEVAQAVKGSFQSVRQGIKRFILDELSLDEKIWKQFDDVYKLRSKVFHGSGTPSADIQRRLGSEAHIICRTIVLAAARRRLSLGSPIAK